MFGKDSTGHLTARFKVGTTVHRSGDQRDLHRMWVTVDLIDKLLRRERSEIAS